MPVRDITEESGVCDNVDAVVFVHDDYLVDGAPKGG
jgi:hypothetical protein